MNLTLRGLPDVRILRRNVLTTTLDRQSEGRAGLPLDGFTSSSPIRRSPASSTGTGSSTR